MVVTSFKKYYQPKPLEFCQRTWPNKRLTKAPRWLSTDLRDGNQALFEPMSAKQKLAFFKLLVSIGFKEIEVGFPSASETEYAFVRTLIEGKHIPAGVTIQVLAPSRKELIEKTFEALRGVERATIHLYNATAPVFREVVFGMSTDEIKALARRGTLWVREQCEKYPRTRWSFEYSPEAFSMTEMAFAKEVCEEVLDAWGACPERPVILNLPATVEADMPNVYADQIEWMHQNLAKRESVTLSVHPHNDRGTAVAAAELALLAGAERVEGCLFGNGERTGNVDLVTLALNLFSHGIDPELDLRELPKIAQKVQAFTQLPIHPRHPYAGDLVFTAFSGSHQDAIRKGMAQRKKRKRWDVPYLPVDPKDLGRTYDSLIRINSQSGKGGIGYVLEEEKGFRLPRRLLIEFSARAQEVADSTGKEVTAQNVAELFEHIYLNKSETPLQYVGHRLSAMDNSQGLEITVGYRKDEKKPLEQKAFFGSGNGPLDAAVSALGGGFNILDYQEHALGEGSNAKAVAYVEVSVTGVAGTHFGVGVDGNIITASLKALISALNAAQGRKP